jgi:hypothetical protein
VRRVTEQALDDWRGRTNGHRAARSAGTRKR